MSRPGSHGFSALEALVAIAILAVAMIPLLVIQTNATRNVTNSQIAIDDLDQAQTALAILDTINVMATPSGERMLADQVKFNWRAEQVSPVRPTLLTDGTTGAFDVALFRVTAEIVSGAKRSAPVTVHQLGWRTRRR